MIEKEHEIGHQNLKESRSWNTDVGEGICEKSGEQMEKLDLQIIRQGRQNGGKRQARKQVDFPVGKASDCLSLADSTPWLLWVSV